MTNLKKIKWCGGVGVAVIFLGALGLSGNLIKLPWTIGIHTIYAYDYSDNQTLIATSDNVFVGKVVTMVSEKEGLSGHPGTQFTVEIVSNIKGNLSGNILVDQTGGYRNGVLYAMEGDNVRESDGDKSALLQPGSTYVLSVKYSNERQWYHLNSHSNARKLLSTDNDLTIQELRDLAAQDEKVQTLSVIMTKKDNGPSSYDSGLSLGSAVPAPPTTSRVPGVAENGTNSRSFENSGFSESNDGGPPAPSADYNRYGL